MNKYLRSILFLHYFIGIGAIAGGLSVIIDPTGAILGVPTEILKYGPFKDFLIPGLFLFFVIGIGNLIAGIMTQKKMYLATYANIGFGGILCLWIIIQCYMLNGIQIVHIVYFVLGVILFLLGVCKGINGRIWPLNKLIKKDE